MTWTARALLVTSVLLGLPRVVGTQITLTRSLQELEEWARKDSNDAEALYAVSLGYWSKKRYDDAERALQLAVTIEPRLAAGWLALGVLPYARRPKLREEAAKNRIPDDWKAVLRESQRMIRRAFLINPLVDLTILGAVEPLRGTPVEIRRQAQWMTASDEWRARLISPFIARVRSSLHGAVRADTALDARFAPLLAARVAEVKWGAEARKRFVLLHDPDIRIAVTYFPRLPELLAGPQ